MVAAPASVAGAGTATSAGIPIGTTTSAPQWARPGRITWPIFAAWNVTVTLAVTATVGNLAGRRVDAARDVDRHHRDAGPRRSRGWRLPPRRAARRCGRCRAARRRRRRRCEGALRSLPRATPARPRRPPPRSASSASPSYGREETTRHEASTPRARSRRVATRPSPPLAPPPQTHNDSPRRRVADADDVRDGLAVPAAISCVPGTPAAIAAASVARIEAASCSGPPVRGLVCIGRTPPGAVHRASKLRPQPRVQLLQVAGDLGLLERPGGRSCRRT